MPNQKYNNLKTFLSTKTCTHADIELTLAQIHKAKEVSVAGTVSLQFRH